MNQIRFRGGRRGSSPSLAGAHINTFALEVCCTGAIRIFLRPIKSSSFAAAAAAHAMQQIVWNSLLEEKENEKVRQREAAFPRSKTPNSITSNSPAQLTWLASIGSKVGEFRGSILIRLEDRFQGEACLFDFAPQLACYAHEQFNSEREIFVFNLKTCCWLRAKWKSIAIFTCIKF